MTCVAQTELPVVDAEGKDIYKGESEVYSLKKHGVFP